MWYILYYSLKDTKILKNKRVGKSFRLRVTEIPLSVVTWKVEYSSHSPREKIICFYRLTLEDFYFSTCSSLIHNVFSPKIEE